MKPLSVAARATLSLGGLGLLTVVGAWLLAGGLFLRPLIAALALERADTAVYLARQVEAAPDPAERSRELASELGVRIKAANPENPCPNHMRRLHRRGKDIGLDLDQKGTVYVPLDNVSGAGGVLVSFPTDLQRPIRRVGASFVLLGLAALLLAVTAVPWMVRPLSVASRAMQRAADGDLKTRCPEGFDATGRMGATFNRMVGRLESLLSGQKRLMAAVSHELRTPLSRMRLSLEMLRDQGAPEGRIQALEQDVAEMDAMVAEILESARLDQGGLALRLEPVDLAGVVEDARTLVDLGDRDLEVRGLAGIVIMADRVRMLRIFTNLFTNVVRYTPPTTHVVVGSAPFLREKAPWLRIRVTDDGPGVSDGDLPHLFDPFFRAEPSRSRRTGGLGLGLMLVRQIVDAHGGNVEARRVGPEGGLELILEMPVGIAGG